MDKFFRKVRRVNDSFVVTIPMTIIKKLDIENGNMLIWELDEKQKKIIGRISLANNESIKQTEADKTSNRIKRMMKNIDEKKNKISNDPILDDDALEKLEIK